MSYKQKIQLLWLDASEVTDDMRKKIIETKKMAKSEFIDINEEWEEVVDFTHIQDGGVGIGDVITALS
ncbi:MAG: hypothetical protein HOE80_02755 [Candidatus Magasanikbacteria bacterium]|jgi:hypothetical protein|nr:hypothetical protein [Candidatus Magasanikbacteria bacterium]MBT4071618.1 hypothetical protein [Candidatus Magasanikbacteria bacterium]